MPANKYSDSLLMDALRGSLSNAESFGRGFGVAPVGLLGDINALAREYITPRLPANVQGLLQSMPSAPTTESILSAIPRMTAPRMESSGMEQIGAAANPRGPLELAKGVGRVAGNAINEAMVYGRGPLAAVTPQPMRMVDETNGLLSYRSSHKAPSPEFGAPLYDLTGGGQMYPADVYSAKATQYYGTGFPKADKEAFALANKVRGNPDAEVTMYRAVPKDEKITNINAGDWVTLSKDYAKIHGESVLGNDYKILSQKVKAKDLWTNADSIHEFGYQPQSIEKPSFQYPQEQALKLAQERAALPIKQGGLGLPPNNTPEMRAKAMGFNAEAYHGTNANVPVFDLSKNITAKDIYSSPNPSEASAYATSEGGNVMPLLLRGEVKDLTKESQYVDNQLRKAYNAQVSKYERQYYPFEQFKESFMRGQLYQDTGGQSAQNALVGELIGNKKSILKIPDAVSDFGIGESYVMQNPANIRSRFAAFDPFRKDVATATAMGVALPDLLAAENNQQPQSAGLLYPLP